MTSAEDVAARLLDPKTPVSGRMRAIFGLKGLNTAAAISALEESLRTDASALVRHEAAYVLGQMRARSALPTLAAVLADAREDVMVRHEAAEALGALGDPAAAPALAPHARDPAREVRETVALALARLGWEARTRDPPLRTGGYSSVDPAPPDDAPRSVPQLRAALCDPTGDLFDRYRAMFALRNAGGEDAVLALCDGMEAEKESALFRHEVAYVLGQMTHEAAVPTLARVLRDTREHEMVRHEAAEALGAVGSAEAERELAKFRADGADVVRESVEVALDISDHVNSDELHYAETEGVEARAGVAAKTAAVVTS